MAHARVIYCWTEQSCFLPKMVQLRTSIQNDKNCFGSASESETLKKFASGCYVSVGPKAKARWSNVTQSPRNYAAKRVTNPTLRFICQAAKDGIEHHYMKTGPEINL
jgi:hypothetical protein